MPLTCTCLQLSFINPLARILSLQVAHADILEFPFLFDKMVMNSEACGYMSFCMLFVKIASRPFYFKSKLETNDHKESFLLSAWTVLRKLEMSYTTKLSFSVKVHNCFLGEETMTEMQDIILA